MSKLVFDLYRYQILPINRKIQGDLFDDIKTVDELIARKQMVLSIYEQVTLIVIVTILLMIRNSSFFVEFVFWIDVLTAACFIYALLILMDTAKSVFKILDF